jgi:hypothetical protein
VPDETPIFEFPFPESTDAPDGPAQIGGAVEAIEDRLAQIELLLGTPAKPAAPAPGNLIVVNGTNDPVYKAITGDVTFNSSGVASIGESKVVASKIAALAVEASKLAANAVETAKIKDLAVTEGKLAALAVATAKIAELAVTTGKIAAGAVTTAKIAAANITTALIADGAVTEVKVADGAVTSRKAKLTAGVVTANENLGLTEVFQNVPGAELKITSAVASKLVMTAIFDFNPTGPSAHCEFHGTLTLNDGAAADPGEDPLAILEIPGSQHHGTVAQVYSPALSAGAHTIKMQARMIVGQGQVLDEHTRFLYELIAS